MKRLLFIMVLLAGAGYTHAQNQLYVGPDGTGVNRGNDCQSEARPCETIAYALSVAQGEETINLLRGTHTERIIIDKSITIRGYDEKTPSILQAATDKSNAVGRVVTVAEGGYDVTIYNLIIQHGRAAGIEPDNRGGGLYSLGNHLKLEKLEVRNNSAHTPVAKNINVDASGGGIYIEGGTGEFKDLVISDNEAEGSGGGLFILESDATFENVTIERNKSGVPTEGDEDPWADPFVVRPGGGGLFVHDMDAVLHNVIIRDNSAEQGQGGGIRASNSNFHMTNSVLSDNVADQNGGGMYIIRGQTRLLNTRITGNQGHNGGGLYGMLHTAYLVNSVLYDNHATQSGGGIFCENSGIFILDNVTIGGNRAVFRGGGIVNQFSGLVRLRNSIIWGNKAEDSMNPAHQIFNGSLIGGNLDSQLSLDYSLYSNFPGDIGGITPISVSNSIVNFNPLFVDAENGNHRLRLSSPARNAGDRDTDYSIYPGGNINPVDLDGNPRVFDWDGGGNIDLGAYEIQGLPLSGPRYVAVGGDDMRSEGGNNCLNIGTPCETITYAMEEAFPGDDVIVGPGVFTEKLNFEKSVNIVGSGSGLDPLVHTIIQAHKQKGASDGRVVTIDDPGNTDEGWDIVISGLTIRNGKAIGSGIQPATRGGGIYNAISALHLFDVLISDNTANIGAGLYNSGTANISNVVFSGNEATVGAGGFGQRGGGFVNHNEAVLVNVIFSNNIAGRVGGGLATGDDSYTTLTNVTFSNNSAANGGGIFNENNATTAIANTILWGNTASDNGNEIQNSTSGVISFEYSLYRHRFGMGDIIFGGSGFTFDNMLAADPLFADADSGNYTLQPESPAINAGNPETDLSMFPTNTEGDHIDLAGNSRIFEDRIDIGAYEYKAVIATPDVPVLTSPADKTVNVDLSVTLQWEDSEDATHYTIQWSMDFGFGSDVNEASDVMESGFAISSLDELTTYFWRVKALRDDLESDWSDPWSFTTRQAVTDPYLYVAVDGDDKNGSNTCLDGKAPCATIKYALTRNVENPVIFLAAGEYTEPGILIEKSVIIQGAGQDNTFIQAHADRPELAANRVIQIHQTDLVVIRDVTIRHGRVTGRDHGGGIHILNTPVDMRNVTISRNIAGSEGAGVYAYTNVPREAAMYRLHLAGVTLDNNVAAGIGGGLRLHNIHGLFTNILVKNNEAAGGAGLDFVGATFEVTVQNSTIRNNTAISDGGGIRTNFGVLDLIDTIIENNHAKDGSGGGLGLNSMVRMDRVQIRNNTSGTEGGGVFMGTTSTAGLDLEMMEVSVVENSAAGQGGGLNLLNVRSVLNNVTISENESNTHGGGVVARGTVGELRMANGVITNNISGGAAAGLFVNNNSNAILTNLTVSGNQAAGSGGGIQINNGANVTIANSIIWGNTGSSGRQFRNEEAETTLRYSLVQNEEGDITDTHDKLNIVSPVTANPRFLDPPEILSVNENSPAINAGDPDTGKEWFPLDSEGISLDFAGNPRMFNGRIDIGAYEFQGDYIAPVVPDVPALISPANEANVVERPIVLKWASVEHADAYRVQLIPVDGDYTAPLFDDIVEETEVEVSDLHDTTAYFWRVKTLNNPYDESGWSEEWQFMPPPTTSVTQAEALPVEYRLHQNYPNPFNPSTVIRYELPEVTDVRLRVFDVLGRRVATLVDVRQTAGRYEVTFNASHLAGGVYLFHLETGEEALTRRMTLVK